MIVAGVAGEPATTPVMVTVWVMVSCSGYVSAATLTIAPDVASESAWVIVAQGLLLLPFRFVSEPDVLT